MTLSGKFCLRWSLADGVNLGFRAGVPQICLPQWADVYDIAQVAERLEIGTWACRETSPDWTPECIRTSILDVLQNTSMASAAAAIGESVRARVPGRDTAAQIIAGLAGSGYA